MKQNADSQRESYGLFRNNCATFRKGILESGGQETPSIIDPRPNSYIDELQNSSEVGLATIRKVRSRR